MTVLWDSQFTPDTHIPFNKSDIVVREKETGTCLVIDVVTPSHCNIQMKVTEKISK